MRGWPGITIFLDLAIPLDAWFVALYGQKNPNHMNVCPAVHVHTRLVERLTRSLRGNRTNVGLMEPGLTALQSSRTRTAQRRYQTGRPLRLEDTRVEWWMDSCCE